MQIFVAEQGEKPPPLASKIERRSLALAVQMEFPLGRVSSA